MRRLWIWAALVLLGATATRAGDTLTIGDPAPPLKVSKWAKGEPITTFEPGRTYVVDFWSTSVEECRAGIELLNDLARQVPEVRFVGVAVLAKDPKLVAPFVTKLGDRMSYSVALDKVAGSRPASGAMVVTWLKAAGLSRIPATFVIKDAKIAWIGRPSELAGPLTAIVAGTYKPEPVAAAGSGTKATVREQIEAALESRDYPAILRLSATTVALDPEQASELADAKFAALCNTGRTDEGLQQGERLLEAYKYDGSSLNNMAWGVVDPDLTGAVDPRVANLALRAMRRAVDLDGTDPDFLDTLAAAQFRTGDHAGAVASAQKALKNISRAEPEDAKELADSLRANIKRYREAAQATGKSSPPSATQSIPKKP